MATYCIGDIQGCFVQLKALLLKIKFNPAQDKLWFTGDLVNRGPNSLEVLRWVKSLGNNAITVLGNHDLHLLAVASGCSKSKEQDTLADILQASDCNELCNWLRQQPLLHYDPQLNYLLVHAGLAPQWDLVKATECAEEVQRILRGNNYRGFLAHMYGNEPDCWNDYLQGWERLRVITNYFTRLRFCDGNGKMELNYKGKPNTPPAGYLPWFKIPQRAHKAHKILFGHWAALEGHTDEPNIYALDTGCVWGNCLTALRLEDAQYFTVPCPKS